MRFALRAIAFDGLRTVTSVVSSVAPDANASANVSPPAPPFSSSSSSSSSFSSSSSRARSLGHLSIVSIAHHPHRAHRALALAFPAPERRHMGFHARELVAMSRADVVE